MKKAQLSGSLRANVGKKDAASLRGENRVPCVLYGQGEHCLLYTSPSPRDRG